jgi:endonuclease/exonuclease/phosphatase family metal-dependent hydrolase
MASYALRWAAPCAALLACGSDTRDTRAGDGGSPARDAAVPVSDGAEPPAHTGELTVLTYNVAGLPEGVSGSHPERNTPQISPRLNAYGLVLVQEDFWYHEVLIKDLEHPYLSEPWLTPPQINDIGDGLNLFSRWPFTGYEHHAWGSCNGEAECGADCLATKGFSFASLTLAEGAEVHVYNLHGEAGGCPEDAPLRKAGMKLLGDTIGERSKGKAVIVGGDFNLHEDDATDYGVLTDLLEQAGLTDACRALACTRPKIDRVLFRSGGGVTFTAKAWAIPEGFVDAESGENLSDHQPVAATLSYAY